MNTILPTTSSFGNDGTRSPFSPDALAIHLARTSRTPFRKARVLTRAPFAAPASASAAGSSDTSKRAATMIEVPATPFYTTPTVRLLETSLGLTAEQIERLFETPAVQKEVRITRTLAQKAHAAYRWFEFSGLTMMLAGVGYAVSALTLG